MTETQTRERAQRGIILAATKTTKISEELWSVNGWLTDGVSWACPDYERHHGPCKHIFAVAVAQSKAA